MPSDQIGEKNLLTMAQEADGLETSCVDTSISEDVEATTCDIEVRGLHKGQREIWQAPARFKVVCAGRRWGKNVLGVLLAFTKALQGGRVWWIGLTFPQARIAWRLLKLYARKIPGTEVREGDLSILVSGGGFVYVKTAENPDGLRGEGLDMVVLDEAAHYRDLNQIWAECVRPALSDRQGSALFISTPNGFNAFHQLWLKAKTQPDWQSWQFPSWSNPHLKPKEIESNRRDLPTAIFNQECGAEFVALAGANAVILPEWLVSAKLIRLVGLPERRVIGADIAWEGDDETVAYCLKNTDIVKCQSWTHQDPMQSAGRLHILAHEYGDGGKYRIPIVVDAIGIGAGVVSRLSEMGDDVISFKSNKTPMSDLYVSCRDDAWWGLRKKFESGEMVLTYNDPELERELLATEFCMKNGKIVVAPKSETKQKLGRSPDRADAYIMGIWGLASAQPIEVQDKAKARSSLRLRTVQSGSTMAM